METQHMHKYICIKLREQRKLEIPGILHAVPKSQLSNTKRLAS
jgi:hypothetical protein